MAGLKDPPRLMRRATVFAAAMVMAAAGVLAAPVARVAAVIAPQGSMIALLQNDKDRTHHGMALDGPL